MKNPNLLVKAEICKSKPKVTVLGDGVLLPEIKDLATKLNFSFEGNVSNVFEYIKRSKVLLLTSNSEGFPNVILEGMSYGLPIIATNCNSGPLEILNDNCSVDIIYGEYYVAKYGILVNVNDDLALSKAIDYLLSNQQLYNKLSLASRNRSQDYDVEIIYEKYKNMLLN
ncbi:glycosyltransferase [Flavobacterium sp.]|uniref:glycosyltransferase n=1 Tax=Flavobacterium sp. TaxID=239 RepID=UPI003528EC3B